MRKIVFVLMLSTVFMYSCSMKDKETNPLLKEWETEYQTVPFDEIKISDYEPAIKKAIEIHNKEIQEIIDRKSVV